MNFDKLESNVTRGNIELEKIFTNENKTLMKQMKALHELELDDMEKAILWSLTEEKSLNLTEFESVCRILAESRRTLNKEKQAKTKEEVLMDELNTVMPEQLLSNLLGGKKVTPHDLNMLDRLQESYPFPIPVFNVLIYYGLLQNNMNLSKPYMEKLAAHWSKFALTTAEEAMAFAKQEIQNNKNNPGTGRRERQLDGQTYTSVEDEKPFTIYEYRYMERLHAQYGMDFDISKEIILYGRRVNQNLLIYWFLDGLADYIHRHQVKNIDATREALQVFHHKFVKAFGKE